MKTININGQLWEKIPEEKPKTSKRMATIMALAAMFGELPKAGRGRVRFPGISSLSKEYELIQNKKSRLSKRERDLVVWKFEQQYRKVVVCEDCLGEPFGYSNCCGAGMDTDTGICYACKEHCEEAKCETCNGTGIVSFKSADNK